MIKDVIADHFSSNPQAGCRVTYPISRLYRHVDNLWIARDPGVCDRFSQADSSLIGVLRIAERRTRNRCLFPGRPVASPSGISQGYCCCRCARRRSFALCRKDKSFVSKSPSFLIARPQWAARHPLPPCHKGKSFVSRISSFPITRSRLNRRVCNYRFQRSFAASNKQYSGLALLRIGRGRRLGPASLLTDCAAIEWLEEKWGCPLG